MNKLKRIETDCFAIACNDKLLQLGIKEEKVGKLKKLYFKQVSIK